MNPRIFFSCFILSLAIHGNCSYSARDNKDVLVLMTSLTTKFYIVTSISCYKLHSKEKEPITLETIKLNWNSKPDNHENVPSISEVFSHTNGLWKFSRESGDALVEILKNDINKKIIYKLLNNSQIVSKEHDKSIIENTDTYKKFYEQCITECEQSQSELPDFTMDPNEPSSEVEHKYKYQETKGTAKLTTRSVLVL